MFEDLLTDLENASVAVLTAANDAASSALVSELVLYINHDTGSRALFNILSGASADVQATIHPVFSNVHALCSQKFSSPIFSNVQASPSQIFSTVHVSPSQAGLSALSTTDATSLPVDHNAALLNYTSWEQVFAFEEQFPALGATFGLWSTDNSWSTFIMPQDSLEFVTTTVSKAPSKVFQQSELNVLILGDEVFSPLLDFTEEMVLEKNFPLRLYDVLPASIDRLTLQNLDSWLLTGDSTPIQTSSVPDTKLYYPEPFVASPSFIHEEIWFLHILYYNYWLWFFFISLIMFYFITFISVVRWCNLRVRPKRETRGVSRSKCADLITACVPVSWAASIIISETVDASDYYDGFGTGELVIGIRAYQWGWEYFYPRNIDTNYNLRLSYSALLGRSVKYSTSSSELMDSNQLWKHFQKKSLNANTNTPGHLLLSPPTKNSSLNNVDFSSVGSTASADPNAFKKIQKYSKLSVNQNMLETSNMNARFNKLGSLYLNDLSLAPNSSSYHTNRQHVQSSSSSFLPSFFTLTDQTSLNRYFSYALGFSGNFLGTKSPVRNYNFFNGDTLVAGASSGLPSRALSSIANPNPSKLLASYSPSRHLSGVKAYDLSKGGNAVMGALSSDFFLGPNKHSRLTSQFSTEFGANNYKSLFSWNLFNEFKGYKHRDLQSTNQQFLSSEKNLRDTPNLSLSNLDVDFSSSASVSKTITGGDLAVGSSLQAFSSSALNWAGQDSVRNVLSSGLTLPHNSSPLLSNSSSYFSFNYDRAQKLVSLEAPTLLKGKEDLTPAHVFQSYWLSHWNKINSEHKYNLTAIDLSSFSNFYLPSIVEYAEYDFKNWQSLDALEDSIWETSYPSFLHEEYHNLRSCVSNRSEFTRQLGEFNGSDRNFVSRANLMTRPGRSGLATFSSPTIYSETAFFSPSTLNLVNFAQFNNLARLDSVEDSYESLRSSSLFSPSLLKNYTHVKNMVLPSFSYATNLNMFRADFEESSWDTEESLHFSSENMPQHNQQVFLTNPLKLRSTVKNLMVTYSAIQKVYRSRFDEGRSNMNTHALHNSYVAYPFLTESRSVYESLMGKNKESYFASSLFHANFSSKFSEFTMSSVANSSLFLDIPFLLSLKSDPSRYLWFDWLSRWVSIEVQPSSIAKYSLAGLPYATRLYEFATQLGEELGDSENYLSKMYHARRNYVQNWSTASYFYLKTSSWFKYVPQLQGNFNVQGSAVSLLFSSLYLNTEYYVDSIKLNSTPSFSGSNTLNKVLYTPSFEISNWDYTSSSLIDLLSKREHFYRLFFASRSQIMGLPDSFVAIPTSKLLLELRSSLGFTDPMHFSLGYNNSQFINLGSGLDPNTLLNTTSLQQYVSQIAPLNFNPLVSFLQFYTDAQKSNFYTDADLAPRSLKSQYKPMRKGVTNMVRLQATNAIAMPTEMRLHILASSKDVIHSWSIPSAGIKIDCVPGYSSHRIAIFLTHGIFWGQCMEICGRYHHWMPIIVYFMKRDLFFLWCAHFIHYSDLNQSFSMLDKSLVDSPQIASFDKNTWISEFSKSTNSVRG